MTTKARATTNEAPPVDVLAAGDAFQARRVAALTAAREGLAEPMAAFDALEAEVWPRVAPLAADFARWTQKYQRAWVRAEPGLVTEFMQLDEWLKGSILLAQFPETVAQARAVYAGLTVEGAAYAERVIRELLRTAEGIGHVEEYHRGAQAYGEAIDQVVARRIANGTLQPPAPQGLAPATSGAMPRGPRHARSAIGSGDQE